MGVFLCTLEFHHLTPFLLSKPISYQLVFFIELSFRCQILTFQFSFMTVN